MSDGRSLFALNDTYFAPTLIADSFIPTMLWMTATIDPPLQRRPLPSGRPTPFVHRMQPICLGFIPIAVRYLYLSCACSSLSSRSSHFAESPLAPSSFLSPAERSGSIFLRSPSLDSQGCRSYVDERV